MRSLVSLVLVLCLVCSMFVFSTMTASAAGGTSMSDAIPLTNGQFYSYRWYRDTFDETDCYFKIVLPKRGYITTYVELVDDLGYDYEMTLYSASGNLIWKNETEQTYSLHGDLTESPYQKNHIGLAAGTYYWKVVPQNNSFYYVFDGSYLTMDCKYIFTESNNWEIEPNDSMGQATSIALDQMVNGALSDCLDGKKSQNSDYYKIHLTKGVTYALLMYDYKTTYLWDPYNDYISFYQYGSYCQGEVDDSNYYLYLFEAEVTGYHYLEVAYDEYSYYGTYDFTFMNATEMWLQPTITSVEPEKNGINVIWTKATSATQYAVYRKTKTGSWQYLATTVGQSYLDATAQSGVEYAYTLRGGDGSVWSSYVTQSDYVKYLGTPKSITATRKSSGVQLSWSKVNGALGYQIYRRTNGAGAWSYIAKVSGGTKVAYLDKTAKSANSYEYKIKTYGAYTTGFSGATAVCLVAPKLTSVKNAAKGINVTWKASGGASKYVVYRKTGNGSYKKLKTVSANTVSYLDKTAKAGTKYTYAVKAQNGSVYSGYSNVKAICRVKQTTGVKVTAASNGLKVKWSKTSGVTGYKVYRKASGGTYKKIATVKGTSYVDKNVKTGVNYSYYVQAYKGAAVGPKSAAASVNVKFTISGDLLYIGQSRNVKKSGVAGKVTFTSSKKSVATINSAGKIVAKKSGNTTITMKGKGFKKTFKIYIIKPYVNILGGDTVEKGRNLSLNAYAAPNGCKIKWKSNKPSVATVNSNGKVTGKNKGTAKITAYITYKGKTYTATKTITVKSLTPNFYASATQYSDCIVLTIANYGSKPMRIYNKGAYFYTGYYTEYLDMENSYGYSCDYIDIGAHSSKTMYFYPSGGGSIYKYSGAYMNFDYRYDGTEYYEYLYWN